MDSLISFIKEKMYNKKTQTHHPRLNEFIRAGVLFYYLRL